MILSLLATHSASTDVAAAACDALRNVAVLECNRAAIVAAGGVATIAHALRQFVARDRADLAHPGSEGVARAACCVLRDLVLDDSLDAVTAAAAIHAIVAALWKHASCRATAEAACRVLTRLAVQPGNRAAFTEACAIGAIKLAGLWHAHSAAVTHASDAAMAALS